MQHEMAKHRFSIPFIKIALLLFFLFTLFVGSQARAERPGNVNPTDWLANLGQIAFSQSGGAFLPGNVLQSMRSGQISPIMQFVLLNNLMNQSVQKSLSLTPDIRDPYIVAKTKFDYGICVIKKAFEQGMVMALLPQLSQNRDVGGSTDPGQRQAIQQQAMAMAQAFQKDTACADSGDGGFDPMIIALLQVQ